MDETELPPSRKRCAQDFILRPSPALLLLGGLLLHHAAADMHHRFVHAHQLLGLLLVAAGVGLAAYAAAIFEARDTTKNPHGQPTAFVAGAPYTFTRNPMYLGLMAVTVRLCVVLRLDRDADRAARVLRW